MNIQTEILNFAVSLKECIYEGKFPNTYTTSPLGARFVEQVQDFVDSNDHPMAVASAVGAIAFTFFDSFFQILSHSENAVYNLCQLDFLGVIQQGQSLLSDITSNVLFIVYGLGLTVLGLGDITRFELLKSASFESDQVKISQLKHAIYLQSKEINQLKDQVKNLQQNI